MIESEPIDATIDEMIELSKQHPERFYSSRDKSHYVFRGDVYTESEWKIFINLLNNQKFVKWALRISNFWRRITFRKPI